MTGHWGFLGASRIGRSALAPAIQSAASQTLHAVAARDPARAAAYAAELGVPVVHPNYEALIADPDIEFVYNALPTDGHAPWTIRALEAGKHVLCEKPLAMNAGEVRAIQAAEQRSGRRAMEAFCHVHHPQYARALDLLSAGSIGRLLAMQTHHGNPLTWEGDFRWQAVRGGGALFDLGCYALSAMRVLSGREPVGVSAVQALRGDVDATLAGQLDFGDGIAGQLTCSFDSSKSQFLAIIGTEGRLVLDWPFATRGRETHLDSPAGIETFPLFEPYVAMVEHFVRAVAGGPMPYGLDWSLAQARSIDALLKSAHTGEAVRL